MVSVQFVGLIPIVKMSKWLEEEIVSISADDSICQRLYDKAVEDGAREVHISMPVTYRDGELLRKGEVGIANDPGIHMKIIEAEHDSQVAGYIGMDKTIKMVKRNFY